MSETRVESLQRSKGEETHRLLPLMIVLLTGAFVTILNQTLLVTALPHIMADLHLKANIAQWLTSIYMLVNGVMIPVTAFLIERFTTRQLSLSAMGLFAGGAFICAMAPNFPVLLLGRVIQASGAGILMPLMQTILFLLFPAHKRGTAMGIFGLIIGFAPAIGPTLSGWFVEHFPWRGLFYLIFPIAMLDLLIACFILKNVTEQTHPKADMWSIVLSTVGFGGLLYGVSIAGTHGWMSAEVLASVVIGGLALLWFMFRQFKLEQPILDFHVFRYPVFSLTTALGVCVFMGMMGAVTVLPLLTQNILGFSALESGLMMLPGAIVMGVMSPITGRIFDRFGAKWLTIVGLSIVTVTTFFFSRLTAHVSLGYLAAMNAVRMLGISLVLMPSTTAGLNQLPRRLIPHGTAMNNTVRQVAGSIGTALLVTIMTRYAIPNAGVDGLVHGVNVSFFVVDVLALGGLVLSFFMKPVQPTEKAIPEPVNSR